MFVDESLVSVVFKPRDRSKAGNALTLSLYGTYTYATTQLARHHLSFFFFLLLGQSIFPERSAVSESRSTSDFCGRPYLRTSFSPSF